MAYYTHSGDNHPGAGAALQEGEGIQEPGHAVRANRVRIKRVHLKRQRNALASGRLILQEVPQVSPEVSGVRATTREALQLKR
jgi:hypothetical protein